MANLRELLNRQNEHRRERENQIRYLRGDRWNREHIEYGNPSQPRPIRNPRYRIIITDDTDDYLANFWNDIPKIYKLLYVCGCETYKTKEKIRNTCKVHPSRELINLERWL